MNDQTQFGVDFFHGSALNNNEKSRGFGLELYQSNPGQNGYYYNGEKSPEQPISTSGSTSCFSCLALEKTCAEKDAKIFDLEQKLRAAQGPTSPTTPDATYELADELKVVHQKKYKLEGQMATMKRDMKKSQNRCVELTAEVERLSKELWITSEKKQQLENDKGHGDWEKTDLGQKLSDATGRIQWLEGELNALWQRFGDMEHRCGELQGFKDRANQYLSDAFVVRKEPSTDRSHKNLAMWNEDKSDNFVRVWFELDAPWAKHVHLVGSFFNWECGLLCTWHDHGKWGVWVDIPRGRHEFQFMADGQLVTSDHFGKAPNGFGSDNNWVIIE